MPHVQNHSLDRRQWLQGTAAAAAAGLITQGVFGANNTPDDSGWVDSHVHVWTNDLASFPIIDRFEASDMVPPSFLPAELLGHARPAGVSRIVLVQMSYYGSDNSYMLEAMRTAPDTFGGIGIVDPSAEPAKAMKELAEHRVRGFRIQPHDATPDAWLDTPGATEMWRCASEESLAMCALINPPFLNSLKRKLREFPDTPVVIDHFARIGIDGQIRREEFDLLCSLAQWPNVNVKISAYYALGKKQAPYTDLGDMIHKVMEKFTPERCMWGSDAPYQVLEGHTYADSIALLTDHMRLSDSDKEAVLRGTATRLFF